MKELFSYQIFANTQILKTSKSFLCGQVCQAFFLFTIFHVDFQNFEAHVRVTNIRSGEVYVVRERVEKDRVTLKMSRYTENKPHLCIYSRSSGFGHTVYGKYYYGNTLVVNRLLYKIKRHA